MEIRNAAACQWHQTQRDADRRVFTDPEVAQLIREEGIRIVSWKQLRALRAQQATQ